MSSIIRTLKEPGSIRILAGGGIVVFLVLAAFLGKTIWPYTPQQMDPDWIMEPPSPKFFRAFLVTKKGLKNLQKTTASGGHQTESTSEDLSYLSSSDSQSPEPAKKKGFGHNHYFGTDRDGRDILALILAGAKTSLLPGLIACLVALGLGIPLGLIGGYYGGLWESSIQFVNSLALSFPRFVLILVIICALEPNLYYVMLVLGLTIIPRISELIKARVKILNNMGFVLAAKEAGLSDLKIMARHLFWFQNRSVLFIQASLIMSESILVETTLSYLQFGAKPPDVSWGSIIEGSRMAFFSEYYWITFFPAVAIVLAILGFFYLGDGLNARLVSREQR